MSTRRLSLLALLCWLVAGRAAQAESAITPLAAARHFQANSASRVGVKLRGIVTAFSGWKNSFFLQDSTGAISVDRLDDEQVKGGDEVEVSGDLHRGLFAPVAISKQVRILGHPGLPPAQVVSSHADLSTGKYDSTRIQVSGIVHAARIEERWGKQVLLVDLQTPGALLTLHVLDFAPGDFSSLVDSRVTVTGVCGTIFNDRRQLIGLRLFVSDLTQIQVDAKSRSEATLPISRIDSLLSVDGPAVDHRVRLTGTVTYQAPGSAIFLQQDNAAVRVESADQRSFPPGTLLEAWGFVSASGYSPVLRNSILHVTGTSKPVTPIPIKASDVIKAADGFTQVPSDGLLIQLEGQVDNRLPNTRTQLWTLHAGSIPFQAQLNDAGVDETMMLEPGTHVRLTGICVAELGENQEVKSFRVLLRSPADIRVVSVAYWNSSLLVLIGICFVIFLGSFLVWLFNSRSSNGPPRKTWDQDPVLLIAPLRDASRVFALIALGSGGVLLLGWALKSSIKGAWAMPIVGTSSNSALFLFAGGLAVLLTNTPARRFTAVVRLACACTVSLTGILTFGAHFTDLGAHAGGIWNQALDGVIDPPVATGGMPIPTALSLLILGCAILASETDRFAGKAQVLALITGTVSLVKLVSYAYGAESRFGLVAHCAMALPSATGLLALSLGLLLSRPDRGLASIISSATPGGFMARRLLPVSILGPLVIGWVRLDGQLLGLYDTRFGITMFALSSGVCFCFFIWASAAVLNRLDRVRAKTERALRERDKKLEMVFEDGAIGDFTWDVAKDEVTAHPSIWKLYGEPGRRGSAPAEWFRSRQHPADAEGIAIALNEAILRREPFDIEFRVLWRDGTVRWLACRGTPSYNDAGRLVQVNGLNIDVTGRKLSESQLKESETLFRELADAMPQIVWTSRADGFIEYYNRRWYDYTKTEFSQNWQECVHPDDVPLCESGWVRSFADGSPFEVELRLKSGNDGSYRWHLARAVPIRNKEGIIRRWFGTSTDIDDSKRASSELRALNESLEQRVRERSRQLAENERRYQFLIECVDDYAIVLLDCNGNVVSWNLGAERIKGYKSSEIIGRHFSAFYTPEDIAMGYPGLQLAIAQADGRHHAQSWRVRRDGSRFWASVLISSVKGPDGELRGFSEIVRDMTEQRVTEELLISAQKRAEDASRAKSSFLAAMSHEIRTPMNAILGMADLLWETQLNPIQTEYVSRFRRAGTNLLTLINNILDLSKIEAGRFELEAIGFDLSDLIDRTIEMIDPKARMNKVKLESRIVPGTPDYLIGDATRLQQILNNLVGNAAKFTENGTVTLTVSAHGDGKPGHLQFVVADTGIGIPEDQLSAIFEDFRQAESSTARRFGGTGLGLGICRRLVERMGGHISVESCVGAGSTFSFDCLLKTANRPPEMAAAEALDLMDCRVLVADDDPTNRLILAEMCASWGMVVIEAHSAASAEQLVRNSIGSPHPISLVLLDHVMPNAAGFETLKQIKSLDPALPVIVVSSDSEPGDVTNAKSFGASAYLTKPIRRGELLAQISAALSPPVARTVTQADQSARASDPIQPDLPVMDILVAEDSEDNRFLLAAYLKHKPYELTFAANGNEAIAAVRSRAFDLIVMDVQMPVMDGLTATTAIRALEREKLRPPTPILALTANALAEDVARSSKAGCDAHLSKPISKDRLIAAIESFRGISAATNAGVLKTPPRPKCNLIDIPEGLEDLSSNYLSSRTQDVDRMQNLLAKQNFDALRSLGHNMKGTGASFGFPGLTGLGAAIEEAAKASNTLQLTEHVATLRTYVEYAADSVGIRA